jgi:type I restriction-modification system DNA methylase subunit
MDREKFSEIYWLFSREALAQGSIEKYAAGMPKPRGKAAQRGMFPGAYKPVDESLLEDLDEYRTELAHSFKKVNPSLDSAELTEITQRTLDRLVFLRFLEDKQIEPQPFVDKFGESSSAWGDFSSVCRRLDNIYNGIIFKRHGILDAERFRLDNESFADICEQLCHLNSPYNFHAIPIHILGSIYERFLGKVIVATGKRVRVDYKPEVRKAGGVYYTPEYIVRYIVENTVGKLIEGKSPDQISEMRFADIACGSGSFLLGVYDLLLRYHGNYYNANPKKARKDGCVDRHGRVYLPLKKKREILLNNIYGVDIDAQAVEVAQLSLYLKLLQEETFDTVQGYQLAFHETLLPSLAKNVVCGNSLVGTDILDGELFPPDEERKLSPMNFKEAFSDVMKLGGFDAIVGNPPWGAEFTDLTLAYLRGKYKRVIARMIDSYIYFLDRAIQLVPDRGLVGFIIPSTLLNQVDAKPVRSLLLSRGLSALVSLGAGIFGSKVLNTSTIVIAGKPDDGAFALDDLSTLPISQREEALNHPKTTPWQQWKEFVENDVHLTFFVKGQNATALLMRLLGKQPTLGNLIPGGIQRGVSPDIAEAHVVSRSAAKVLKFEADLLRPSVSGSQIKRYCDWKSDQFIIYTTRNTQIKRYTRIARYLGKYRTLNSCPEVRQGKHPWWALHRPRDPEIFSSPKIIGLTTTKTIELIYDPKGSVFVTDAMYVFHAPNDCDAWAFIAIMQSKLFLFLYRTSNQGESRIIPQVKASKLEALPFPSCYSSRPNTERLTKLAIQLLEGKKRLAAAKTDRDKTYYESKCAALDRQIDRLVYDLYGLTEDEIQIVEKGIE